MTASAFNNYGMFNSQQFYNDPYFLQAFYSPNANQMYQGQQTATPQGNQQVSQALAGNPSFQGAQQIVIVLHTCHIPQVRQCSMTLSCRE